MGIFIQQKKQMREQFFLKMGTIIFESCVSKRERADLLALVCGVFCEFVTFPLVSWVRCGT